MMKNKLTLLALACGLSFAANAQIIEEEETLKPAAGNKTLEVSLLGGGSGQIKLRSFTSDQLAFRYTTGIAYDYNKVSAEAYSTSFAISFAPGVEKHFAGTKRLSPYLGFAVPLTIRNSRYKSDYLEVKGATSEQGYDRSFIAAGIDGLAGVDFYVAKNFYVGFETGVGLSYLKYGDVEVKYKNDVGNTSSKSYHGVSFNTFTMGGLRVGFAF